MYDYLRPRATDTSPVVLGLIAAGAIVTGILVVRFQMLAWAILGLAVGLLCIQAPVHIWITAALLTAVLSRIAVATGFVPSIFNFFHFPFAAGAACMAGINGKRNAPGSGGVAAGFIGLFALSCFSAAAGQGSFLRAALTWLVFCEPFLIVFAILKIGPDERIGRYLWRLALLVAIVQIPPAYFQAVSLGLGDTVQGTFVGAGAGHHVSGAIVLTGALMLIAQFISVPTEGDRPRLMMTAILLFIVSVLSDSKQCIVGFILALFPLLTRVLRSRWGKILPVVFMLFAGISAAFYYYEPLHPLLNGPLVGTVVIGKILPFVMVIGRMAEVSGAYLFGLGPGNSMSRVALMGLDAYVNPNSPVALLGLKPSPVTQELWTISSAEWTQAHSSVWSSISSWLGLFGDLGILGVGIYLLLCILLWRRLKKNSSWKAGAARGAMVMAGFLGLIFSWLEEPGYMLTVALAVGTALISGRNTDPLEEETGESALRS